MIGVTYPSAYNLLDMPAGVVPVTRVTPEVQLGLGLAFESDPHTQPASGAASPFPQDEAQMEKEYDTTVDIWARKIPEVTRYSAIVTYREGKDKCYS